MTTYVTEQTRTFDSRATIKQLRGVTAHVSDSLDSRGALRDFKPEDWRALLRGGDVMYRYRDEPYRRVS